MKRYLSVVVLLGVIILFSCTSAPAPASSDGTYIPDDIAGLVHAIRTRAPTEMNYLESMGTRWILRTFFWADIEPYPGEFDFLSLDAYVDTAEAAGLKVLGVLAYDNWWIHDDKNTHHYIPAEKIPYFLDYVRKTAEHFRGRVDAWAIWNEPNFHFWNGTDAEFIELSRQTAEAIREVDSEVILIGGGFIRNLTSFGVPEKFIRGLFESGAMDNVDVVAFHPYEFNPRRSSRIYNMFREIVADYGFDDKIWVTEVGYPTGGWSPTKVNEKRFPEYVVKTWVSLASAGPQKIFWYQMFDPLNRSRRNSEHYFGLTRSVRDYTSKGAEAFRLCAMYLSDTICYPMDPQQFGLPKSVRLFWFSGAENSTLILWKDGLGSRQVKLQLPGTDHLMHDIVTGDSSSITAEITIKAGRNPVFITWQTDTSNDEVPVINAR